MTSLTTKRAGRSAGVAAQPRGAAGSGHGRADGFGYGAL